MEKAFHDEIPDAGRHINDCTIDKFGNRQEENGIEIRRTAQTNTASLTSV